MRRTSPRSSPLLPPGPAKTHTTGPTSPLPSLREQTTTRRSLRGRTTTSVLTGKTNVHKDTGTRSLLSQTRTRRSIRCTRPLLENLITQSNFVSKPRMETRRTRRRLLVKDLVMCPPPTPPAVAGQSCSARSTITSRCPISESWVVCTVQRSDYFESHVVCRGH